MDAYFFADCTVYCRQQQQQCGWRSFQNCFQPEMRSQPLVQPFSLNCSQIPSGSVVIQNWGISCLSPPVRAQKVLKTLNSWEISLSLHMNIELCMAQSKMWCLIARVSEFLSSGRKEFSPETLTVQAVYLAKQACHREIEVNCPRVGRQPSRLHR